MAGGDVKPEEKGDDEIIPLDDADIDMLKHYGAGMYVSQIKEAESQIKKVSESIHKMVGAKESSTGLAIPAAWDLVADKQMMQEEQPLQVRFKIQISKKVKQNSKLKKVTKL